MLSPFMVCTSGTPYPTPCFYEGVPIPTHPFLPPQTQIPLHWCIQPSQDQRTLLPLMPDKAILCYTCGWSHGFLHIYSLVSGLVPGSSGGTGSQGQFPSLSATWYKHVSFIKLNLLFLSFFAFQLL